MNSKRGLILTILLLALLAGVLRFYRLGAWAFVGDELATLEETKSLFVGRQSGSDSQIDRLPRLVPLAHLLHWAGYQAFGQDEFGSRAVPAALGVVQVVLVFLLLRGLLPAPTALTAAVLLAVWPTHLLFSQMNRFYVSAAVFTSLTLLVGAWAARRRSVGLTALACGFAMAAVLCHTIEGLLFGGLFVALTAGAAVSRQPQPWKQLAVVLTVGLAAAVFFCTYLWPLLRGWNQGEPWGYSPWHSLQASFNQLGWPNTLLAALGLLALRQRHDEQGAYWVTWALVFAAVVLILPLFVTYHTGYSVPLALATLVPVAYAVTTIYQALRPAHPMLAGAWVGAACLLNLPGLLSHYADGSRHDWRAAAEYVARNWRPGDRVAATSSGLLDHYLTLPMSVAPLPLRSVLEEMNQLSQGPGRVWIVLSSGRSGLPADQRAWLGKYCFHRYRVRCHRFDYYDYIVDVFLFVPPTVPTP